MSKHETETNLTEQLEKLTQSGNETWPVFVMLPKKNFLLESSMKNVAWKLVPDPY